MTSIQLSQDEINQLNDAERKFNLTVAEPNLIEDEVDSLRKKLAYCVAISQKKMLAYDNYFKGLFFVWLPLGIALEMDKIPAKLVFGIIFVVMGIVMAAFIFVMNKTKVCVKVHSSELCQLQVLKGAELISEIKEAASLCGGSSLANEWREAVINRRGQILRGDVAIMKILSIREQAEKLQDALHSIPEDSF